MVYQVRFRSDVWQNIPHQKMLTTFQVADPAMIGRQYSALGQTFTVSDIFTFGFSLFAMNLFLIIVMHSICIHEKDEDVGVVGN